MSKFGSFGAYPGHSLFSAEAALLTAWPSLVRYHDDIVLVGGLAIHYLTRRDTSGLPGAVTIDVDFAISLGASGGQYGTIKSDLQGLGFVSESGRLVRKEGGIGLYIDFLTEGPSPNTAGSCIIDDVPASFVPGVNRALICRRTVTVRGLDVFGVRQECNVKIADIGPLLVLKLNAFGGRTGRRLPKDAYDVLLAVIGFVDGPVAAIEAFRAEKEFGNPAYDTAVAVLQKDFSEVAHDGPVRAAAFLHDSGANRDQVRQDLVTVARSLLGNLGSR
jgi:hypothetical protein